RAPISNLQTSEGETWQEKLHPIMTTLSISRRVFHSTESIRRATTNLASGEGGGVLEPVLQRGGGAGRRHAVPLDGGEAELDGEAGVPEARRLVHVLVEPAPARRQVELAHHERQLRVQPPEQRGG